MASSSDQPELPQPKDLSHLLSRTTRNRQASSIKGFYKYFSIPGIGQLAGGLPNQHYFPFDNLAADSALPDRWKPTSNKPIDPPSETNTRSSTLPSAHLLVPKESHAVDRTRKIDVTSALQYGTAEGYPPLRQWLRTFVREHMHPGPEYAGGPEIILTVGSTDGFAKTLQAFNNEWTEGRDPIDEREGLLVEEYAYMNAVQAARPRGMRVDPVAIDDEGMCARGTGGLQEVLDNWDHSKGKRPHLMYTVTMGQNPTSGVLSLERRREIYALCSKYDIIICEDDPYWFLQYPSSTSSSTSTNRSGRKSSGYAFLDSLVPSYISIDFDGRVVRLDTFSKTIAPGCRMGWITAQPALIERIQRITETTTQQPSGFVQSLVCELLSGPLGPPKQDHGQGGGVEGQGYGYDGWVRWLEGLRGNYERRMNVMSDILDAGKVRVKTGRRPSLNQTQDEDEWAVVEKGAQMYDFVRPVGGMFLWLRIFFERHPLYSHLSGARLSRALWILWTRKPYLVLVSPGGIFAPTEEIRNEDAWRFFRLCFAACEEPEVKKFSERIAAAVSAFWGMSEDAIQDLLDEDEADQVLGPEMEMLVGFC